MVEAAAGGADVSAKPADAEGAEEGRELAVGSLVTERATGSGAKLWDDAPPGSMTVADADAGVGTTGNVLQIVAEPAIVVAAEDDADEDRIGCTAGTAARDGDGGTDELIADDAENAEAGADAKALLLPLLLVADRALADKAATAAAPPTLD